MKAVHCWIAWKLVCWWKKWGKCRKCNVHYRATALQDFCTMTGNASQHLHLIVICGAKKLCPRFNTFFLVPLFKYSIWKHAYRDHGYHSYCLSHSLTLPVFSLFSHQLTVHVTLKYIETFFGVPLSWASFPEKRSPQDYRGHALDPLWSISRFYRNGTCISFVKMPNGTTCSQSFIHFPSLDKSISISHYQAAVTV